MMLPSFFCVGSQKAGTTTLHDILVQHPDICLPKNKETKFFQSEKYEKGIKYYQKTYFKNCGKAKIAGEIDPDYMYFPYVPQRIFNSLGDSVKLIFILRNPIDRAYSHYWMSVRRGHEKFSFKEALLKEPERLESGGEFERLHFSYLDRGRYRMQIENFLRHFPQKNMKFIIFENFVKDIEATVISILDFLKVNVEVELDWNVRSNPSSKPRSTLLRDFVYGPGVLKKVGRALLPIRGFRRFIVFEIDKMNQRPVQIPPCSGELRRDLLERFVLSEIEKLEVLLGKNLSIWKQ